MSDWNINAARQLYNLNRWGGGYFDISDQGRLVVRPHADSKFEGVDLYGLCDQIRSQGLSLPVLIRFTDILADRVKILCQAFDSALAANAYKGKFTPVYPIKVNQQRGVVEAILDQDQHSVGLEAGSKPELLAVLALADQQQGVIVCNGYKDREYVRLALIGRRLGHQIFIVVEKLSELELVIEESRKMEIVPLVGVRMRMATLGAGRWQNTGGEKSKFGLSAAEVLTVIDRLREINLLNALCMLHFHMGSQITDIHHVQLGIREAGRYYAELMSLGANIQYVNVGGGLGIDYEGTRSSSYFSTNYGVQEYANNIVNYLKQVCAEKDLPYPHIITEAGRAMTAHHAVLVTNVVNVEQALSEDTVLPAVEADPILIQDMWHSFENLSRDSAVETYQTATDLMSKAQNMFSQGDITLIQRAHAEHLFFGICHRVRDLLQNTSKTDDAILDQLNEKLADKYFCNFSLFQSLPDIWAIDQIFPIVPLHRLDEPPSRRGVVVDITCDSDGRINKYVDSQGLEASLPVHALKPDETYLLGFFLVGAYQEILGDMHNLFGDTDSVDVQIKTDEVLLSRPMTGDDVSTVLRYVHFDPDELLEMYRQKLKLAEAIDSEKQEEYLQELTAGLEGYTYLED